MVLYEKYLITHQNNFSTNRKHNFQNVIIKRFTTEYTPTYVFDWRYVAFRFSFSNKHECGSWKSKIWLFHTFQRIWRQILLISSLILNHGHCVVEWCVHVCQSANLLAAFGTWSKVWLALINYLSPSRYCIHDEQSFTGAFHLFLCIISSEYYVPQTVNQKIQRYVEWD